MSWKSPRAPTGLRAAGLNVDSASAIQTSSGGRPSSRKTRLRRGISRAAAGGGGRPVSWRPQRATSRAAARRWRETVGVGGRRIRGDGADAERGGAPVADGGAAGAAAGGTAGRVPLGSGNDSTALAAASR